ncbi:DUF6011 domain-containing protein [Dermacoccus sp. CCH2-D9]|uniref:DUF6011 domain-containing protein n=1 Tax=Dermacoccus sp. CCH2-D9 TaxID=1768779 RepID=UPI001E2CA81C|nr:DUF6011 domain-containing protein [Dermacoccus sp. CCH2-D9]
MAVTGAAPRRSAAPRSSRARRVRRCDEAANPRGVGGAPGPVVLDLAPHDASAGSVGRCRVCGRPLRSPESIARGSGPECSKKV